VTDPEHGGDRGSVRTLAINLLTERNRSEPATLLGGTLGRSPSPHERKSGARGIGRLTAELRRPISRTMGAHGKAEQGLWGTRARLPAGGEGTPNGLSLVVLDKPSPPHQFVDRRYNQMPRNLGFAFTVEPPRNELLQQRESALGRVTETFSEVVFGRAMPLYSTQLESE
jgi:hypothetical protein